MSKSCSQMASSSSRCGKKAAHFLRNPSPNGWISDDEERYKFGCYRKLFEVVPHKFLDVELFRREGFIFQEWLVDVGLLKFVEMTVSKQKASCLMKEILNSTNGPIRRKFIRNIREVQKAKGIQAVST
ncbi:uncharacterized protein HKW66_Vig0247050 [Vigna angularis]|uniref:Uncharacterized protein n=1 Tax=Phaseolus angularis TaxID=3914 RepID=A0A8T0KZ22_PHAAN|nr:uncharacterized protein HKW66_Vig0247050 [Vigna angularis]